MTSAGLLDRGLQRLPELADLRASPIERWSLPAAGAFELWVKRDDQLGAGGSKVRKLRVALGRARREGASLLTFGPLDSNHALATARAASAIGLPVRLSIVGDPILDPSRAERLRAAASTEFYRNAALAASAAALWLVRGVVHTERRRLLPPGGTTSSTTAAIAVAVSEVVDQFAALGVPLPQRWAVAVGTGGTLAGLLAGVRALGLQVELTGVLASSRVVRRDFIAWLANRALSILGCAERLSARDVTLDGAQLGQGHGIATVASSGVLRDFEAVGHVLDPVFTAKAMAALIAKAKGGDRWLFWHTGLSV